MLAAGGYPDSADTGKPITGLDAAAKVPNALVFVGGAIVIAAGLFVIWRERVQKLRYERVPEEPPTPI